MARIHYWQFLINNEGQPIPDANITVYEAGTSTPAYIFTSEFGQQAINTTNQVSTNNKGFFEFWVADSEETFGYPPSQKFRISWAKTGVESGFVDWVDILKFVSYPVDQTDAANIKKDKLVSNALAYGWESHKNRQVETQVVHGLQPVDANDSNAVFNKVVSNKTLNDIILSVVGKVESDGTTIITSPLSYENTVLPGDFSLKSLVSKEYVDDEISALVLSGQFNPYTTVVAPVDWSLSGDGSGYFVTITHNLSLTYPTVTLWTLSTGTYEVVTPSRIQGIDGNTTRIYYTSNIDMHIRIF